MCALRTKLLTQSTQTRASHWSDEKLFITVSAEVEYSFRVPKLVAVKKCFGYKAAVCLGKDAYQRNLLGALALEDSWKEHHGKVCFLLPQDPCRCRKQQRTFTPSQNQSITPTRIYQRVSADAVACRIPFLPLILRHMQPCGGSLWREQAKI